MFKSFKLKKSIQLPEAKKIGEDYDLVVHIGAPKAGSSAIQKYLLENRSKLLEVGFYYPEHSLDENGISGGHSNIGKNLKDSDFATAKAIIQTHLDEAKQRNCTLIISAESLFIRAEELKEIIGEHRCKIIAFFRDPLESLYSNYNQGIKRNYSTARLKPYCQNLLDKPADFLSGKLFDKWATTFGKEHLIVVGYDLELFSQTPIQSVFLSMLGIDDKQQKQHFKFDSQFINNSYSLAALELKRMFNFVLDQEKKELNHEIDWFLQGVSDRNENEKYYLIERIDPETYTQLKEKFSSSTPKVRAEYLLELNPNFLNESKRLKIKTINQRQLNSEMADVLAQLNQLNPKVYLYIQQEIEHYLKKNSQNYEVIKLAEMFNYDINQIKELEKWFKPNKLKNMPNMQLVDFYRDISQLCYQRGDLENAQLLIERALEIRPNGPAIIKLSEEIKHAKSIK